MKRRGIIYVVVALLCLTDCTNKRHVLKQLAVENPKQSVGHLKRLQVLAISELDSALDFCYFSQQEKAGIIRIMKSAADSIMERTNNMQSLNISDFHVMDLAERQMRANSDTRQMLSQATSKKEWTGWKVKIDYQVVTHHDMKYNAEWWFSINKDGKSVMRTFELPLP